MKYIAAAFDGEPIKASGNMIPRGMKKAKVGKRTKSVKGEKFDDDIKVNVKAIDIWLCEESDEGEIKKIRVIHVCTGPTASAQAKDFTDNVFKPDFIEASGAVCPADGYTPREINPEQMEMTLP